MIDLHFELNGAPVHRRCLPERRLLDILREDFALTGAKPGCEIGRCGACMVWLDGEPVTCISVVRYGVGFGFLGCYIARPVVRGKGYGIRIWEAGMQRLAGRNVGLDGGFVGSITDPQRVVVNDAQVVIEGALVG